PAVYIMILPAMGIISEMIPVFSRKHIFGYTAIAYSSIAIAMFSFIVWGHHMFAAMSPLANMVFSAVTFSVSIPSAVKVFNWTATMYKGSIRLATPMLYALSFLFLFTIGGLTGLYLATLGTDIHLHDTYFVVAHFHYVMVGSTMIAFIGGLHYWWPKIFGKMYSEKWGNVGCIVTFLGFNITFLPQFVLGMRGMPRRYYDYIPEFEALHRLSSIGAFIMGIGLFVTLFCLVYSLFKGKPAPDNPWGSASMEWQATSPPHYHNFTKPPKVGDPYDYTDLVWDPKSEGYYRKAEGQGAA
ncbi:MAG: cbb3-type cytochrome c oxidase subunit I, partial [Candidatus Omnitrophica bacterium]|nr:cbb3-type cytochrome c oxidase subunit I [Candidatus Omnitrophota bacterium]